MTQEIKEIAALSVTDLNFDFNKDGKIDLEDYQIGCKLLATDQQDEDDRIINFTQAEFESEMKELLAPQKESAVSETVISKTTDSIEDTEQQITDTVKSTQSTTSASSSSLTKSTTSSNFSSSIKSISYSAKGTTELKNIYYGQMEYLSELQDKLKDLQDEHDNLVQQGTTAEAEFVNAENNYNDTAENLENENAALAELSQNYNSTQANYNSKNQELKTQNSAAQNTYKNNVDNAKQEAAAEYNEDMGIDYQTFVNNKVNSVAKTSTSSLQAEVSGFADAVASQKEVITNKSSDVQNLSANLDTAQSDYESCANTIEDINVRLDENCASIKKLNKEISSTEDDINCAKQVLTQRVDGSCLTGAEVLAQISNEEKQLVLDNNIDMTTCLVAKGADGNWHIYDENGTSLARTYGSKKGYDIVANGSGRMRDNQAAGEYDQGSAVYKFTSVNADLTDGTACWTSNNYTTSSPLSFDIDGDGVNTSSQIVSFDIDGDGQKDKVNNSSEWVLAFDKDGDGKVGSDGSELFGDNTDLNNDGKKDGYSDGFAALKALAKQENLIGENDNVLDENDLKVLSEKYNLSMTKGYGGETKSLQELGITQINLASTDKTTLNKNYDGRNNDLMTQEGATFIVNGQERNYADIWNSKKTITSTNKTLTSDNSSTTNPFQNPDVILNSYIQDDVTKTLNQSYSDNEEMADSNIQYENLKNVSTIQAAKKRFTPFS